VLSPTHLHGSTADLIISELLGSFGCNEVCEHIRWRQLRLLRHDLTDFSLNDLTQKLSPECLDPLFWSPTGVCRPDTFSIPTRYVSTLAPVSSIHLHRQVQLQALFPASNSGSPSDAREGIVGLQEAFETPYVVRTHAASQMSPEQVCWEFVHPVAQPMTGGSMSTVHDRHVKLSFPPDVSYGRAYGCGYGAADRDVLLMQENSLPVKGTHSNDDDKSALTWKLTGLLGTFTAALYPPANPPSPTGMKHAQPSVEYATTPSRFSSGMFSWFPLYFPIATPMSVPPGASVNVNIWRKTDQQAVWYEWSAQVATAVPGVGSAEGMESMTSGSPQGGGKVLAAVIAAASTKKVVWSESPIHNPCGRSSRVSLLTS
jgi:type II protein arginine methyltransferase